MGGGRLATRPSPPERGGCGKHVARDTARLGSSPDDDGAAEEDDNDGDGDEAETERGMGWADGGRP